MESLSQTVRVKELEKELDLVSGRAQNLQEQLQSRTTELEAAVAAKKELMNTVENLKSVTDRQKIRTAEIEKEVCEILACKSCHHLSDVVIFTSANGIGRED